MGGGDVPAAFAGFCGENLVEGVGHEDWDTVLSCGCFYTSGEVDVGREVGGVDLEGRWVGGWFD